MNIFKNLHLLKGVVSEADLNKIEHAALQHQRYSNITFKAIECDARKITIEVTQGRSASENYQDKKRLVEIVHETFDRFFPGMKMNIGAVPYKKLQLDEMDPEWISKKMNQLGVSLKQIVNDTGLNKSQVSALINGIKPLSQPMKVVFWFYFRCKELEKKAAMA